MSRYGQEDRMVRMLRMGRTLLELRAPDWAPQQPHRELPPGPKFETCTCSVLENLSINRRGSLRVRESLRGVSLGGPFGRGSVWAQEVRTGESGEGNRQGLLRLLLEIDRVRRRGGPVAENKRLAVHAEIVRGSFLYFLAFLDVERPEPGQVALSHFDISGSGVCFPTQVRHRAGERLLALLFLPVDPLPPLKLELEVVRPSQPILPAGQAYLTAARFLNLDPEARARILAYVAARQKERMLERAYGLSGRTDSDRLRPGWHL